MVRKMFFIGTLVYSICLTAQNNYKELMVRETPTYWAKTESGCTPQWNMIETGIYFCADSLFGWYKITDEHDTLSLYDGIDTEMFVDHRSFIFHDDTLFITDWYNEHGRNLGKLSYNTSEAYKIAYLTEHKLVLIQLRKDTLSGWIEYLWAPCNELNILEFDCTKK